MSTGSVTKKPEPELSYSQAHEWCIELRAILGNVVKQKLGIGTDAKKLAQAEGKVFDRIKELHKLFPEGLPKEARELENSYSNLAKDGFLLREQYLGYEKEIEALTLQVKSLETQRKSKETKNSANRRDVKNLIDQKIAQAKLEIETAKELQVSKKGEIASKAGEFLELADELKEKVDDRIKKKEDYRKDLLGKKIPPATIKLILEAQANWKKQQKESQKLVDYFVQSCDSAIAKTAGAEFQKCSVDIYSIYSVEDAQRLLTPMADFLHRWGTSGTKGKVEAARERFKVAYLKSRELAMQAQKVCEGSEFNECMHEFTEGESQSIQRNWLGADLKVNQNLIQKLEMVIRVGANGKVAWRLASEQLQKFKSDLDLIGDPAYSILALTPLGEAYKLADQQEYLDAVQKFNANEASTSAVIEVAKSVELIRQGLSETRDAILEMITMIPHGPMSLLANTFDNELQGLPDAFWSKRHVSTIDALNRLKLEYTDRLTDIKITIQCYTSTDPEIVLSNAKLVEELKSGRNVEACKEVIQSLINGVSPAISEYKAAFFDPAGTISAQPMGTWELNLKSALEFHSKLVGHTQEKDPVRLPPNEIQDGYKTNQGNLDGLAKTIRELIAGQASALDLTRGQITEALKWFKATLFIARLDTVFKEATWHKEAKLEHEELLALATVDNLAQLQQLLPRAMKLKERCQKVLKAMPQKILDGILGPDESGQPAMFEGTIAQNEYDSLKRRLSSIRSALKDRDVLFYVPRNVDRVANQLSQSDSALRSDGYIGLTDNIVLVEHKSAVTAVESSLQLLQEAFGKVKPKRIEVDSKLVHLQSRITTELVAAIGVSTGQTVTSEHLPIMQSALAMAMRLNTEDLKAFSALEVEIGMLEDDLNLLLLDADSPDGLKNQVDAVQKGEAEKRKAIERKCKAKVDYEIARSEFDELWKKLKAVKGVDKTEMNAIRSIKGQAIDATKSKPENWSKATKDIKLAILLSERLLKDPLASQATDRGQKHLNELTPRWISGIDRLSTTVNPGLQGAILSSCELDSENIADAAGVAKLFESTIAAKFSEKTLVKEAFASELLVLSRVAGGTSAEKLVDKKEKNKAREQALVKIRFYKNMIQKDPIYQNLLFKKNPWSNQGGQVDGLPLMRALNDLELNVERGIY